MGTVIFARPYQIAVEGWISRVAGSFSKDHRDKPRSSLTNETIFPSRRNRPETGVCSDRSDQTTGCDHAGHYPQPVLPAILQGSSFRHPAPKTDLGLRRAWGDLNPTCSAAVRVAVIAASSTLLRAQQAGRLPSSNLACTN